MTLYVIELASLQVLPSVSSFRMKFRMQFVMVIRNHKLSVRLIEHITMVFFYNERDCINLEKISLPKSDLNRHGLQNKADFIVLFLTFLSSLS